MIPSTSISRSAWRPSRAAPVGPAILAAAVLVVALSGGGQRVAVHAGPTMTTTASVPEGVPTDLKEAQADLAKLDALMASEETQQRAAKSELATIEKDMHADTLPGGSAGTVVPGRADQVSADIARLFQAHADEYAALQARAAAVHDQFVRALEAAAGAYAAAASKPVTPTP